MKVHFLPLLVLPFLVIATASAGDWGSSHSSRNLDVRYKEEAAPYIQHVEDTWLLYQVSRDSWHRIEALTTAEYQTKNLHLKVRLDVSDLKPVLKSKIKFKGQTINFVFAYMD